MSSYNAIGIMSGTSLDGLDIVLCNLSFTNKWNYHIIKCETIKYNELWVEKLSSAQNLSGYDLAALNNDYGTYIGESVLDFLKGTDTKIDLIASHGHTVFHQPEKQITLQIGNGKQINSSTGITTISDFRSLDVAMGGQGAPLVPVGDKLLFPEYDYCINIGGFANISFEEKDSRRAYDICPANIILNFIAGKLGHPYDKDGNIGRAGKIDNELLNKLNNINYYKEKHPKSLAREWLEKTFAPILERSNISLTDQLATLYEHIAFQISNSTNNNPHSKILITGGGAYNNYLIDLIKQKIQSTIILPEKTLIEYKEALIFALLGVLKMENKINCLSSVTGAKQNSCVGVIHQSCS